MAQIQYTTVTKSITLAPNESFTLPPDATVTSVIGAVSSTCGALPDPETLECYGSYYEVGEGGGNSSQGLLDEIKILGIRVNNKNYLFDTLFVQSSASGDYTIPFKASLASNEFTKNIMFSGCCNVVTSQSNQGSLFIAIFKGFPSFFGKDAFFIAEMRPGDGNLSGVGYIPFYLPIVSYDKVLTTTGALSTVCPCSNETPATFN